MILRMATSPTTDDTVSEFAGQLFFRLWRASHTRTAEALESLGLTTALFALLNVLGTREGAIQQELGSAMGIDPSTMVSLIDQLERRTGQAPAPTNGSPRTRGCNHTKGRRALEQARRLAMQVEDDVLRGLSPAERRRMLALLRRAVDSAPRQSPWTAEEGD